MAVDIKVVRHLPDNYVQVDVTPKNMDTRHYKMPASQVDSFTASYKKFDSNTRWNSTILLIALVTAGAALGTIIPRALKAKPIISMICGVIGAFTGDVGATMITANSMRKNEAKILKSNNAHEISYNNNLSFLK